MKVLLFILYFGNFLSTAPETKADWGQTGHRSTGAIATEYLSKKASKKIDRLLNGASLAIVSTYADEIKSDDRYRTYGPWHYVNFPFGSTYLSHPKSEKGDLVQGINTCRQVLQDDSASIEEKQFYLKLLVHLMGDLHQPLHTGIAEDRGGNDFDVSWFGEETNLHTVWDTKMIESYNMSYSELANNTVRLSSNQLKEIEKGDVLDWVLESKALCQDIYENTQEGDNLSYRYMYLYMETVRFQIQKGGIRLAKILNEIYD